MNPATGPSHAQNFQPGPSSRQPARGYAHVSLAAAEDMKYHAKYKDLKRKVKDLESNNDQLYAKVYSAKRNIQRMKLERAILYERLSSVPSSPDLVERHASHHHTSAAVPPPHLPHHRGREPRDMQYNIPSDNHYRSDPRAVYEPEIPHTSTVTHSSRRGGAGGSSVHDRTLPSLSQMSAASHATAAVPPPPPRSELASPVEARRSHSTRSARHEAFPETYQQGAPWDEAVRRHRDMPSSAMASLSSPHMHASESRSHHTGYRTGPAASSYREDAYDRERERDPDVADRSMSYRDPPPSNHHQYETSSTREREWDDRERLERERERLSPPPYPQRSERERERERAPRESLPSNSSRIYASGGNNNGPPPPQIRHSRPVSPASASGLDVTGPSRPDSRNGDRPYRLHSTGPPAPQPSQISMQRGERLPDEMEYSREPDHRQQYMHPAASASRPHSQSPVVEARKRLWNEMDEGHGGPANYADERNHHRRFSGEARDLPPVEDRMELS